MKNESRVKLIDIQKPFRMQLYMRLVRDLLGWTTEDMGEELGVSKQTVSNLERYKTLLSYPMYLALRAILTREINYGNRRVALYILISQGVDEPYIHEPNTNEVQEEAIERYEKISEYINRLKDAYNEKLAVISAIHNGLMPKDRIPVNLFSDKVSEDLKDLWGRKENQSMSSIEWLTETHVIDNSFTFNPPGMKEPITVKSKITALAPDESSLIAEILRRQKKRGKNEAD